MYDLNEVQSFLKKEKLDGWLIADFHARNSIAIEFLELNTHLTRRSFYYIPSEGEPYTLMNYIERDRFEHLPGKKEIYVSYKTLETKLAELLKDVNRIAMEYSPYGRLPYIGMVDAGTIELVKSFGVEIVSSADLVSYFQARLNDEQIKLHKQAALLVNEIKDSAFQLIGKSVKEKKFIDEFMVQKYILDLFEKNNMTTDFPPCCAVNANIGNPHYMPTEEKSSEITENCLVLIDLWAKLKTDHGIFADITWMAYTGTDIPAEYSEIFSIVTNARDRAVEYIKQEWPKGTVFGCDADDACRSVIERAGYGDKLPHRTGHSIAENVHGPGPGIDNLESEDRRKLLPGHLFSIEPGIYLDRYGFRSEINCLLTEDGPEVTTQPLQAEILALLE